MDSSRSRRTGYIPPNASRDEELAIREQVVTKIKRDVVEEAAQHTAFLRSVVADMAGRNGAAGQPPRAGRGPRQASNTRTRGSRRVATTSSGQDPGDPDAEPPDECDAPEDAASKAVLA